jgi:proteasome lid subunit RPN8/RPN11
MRISQALLDELITHARGEAPNECVGVITGRDGVARRVITATNAAHSPLRYELDPRELLRIHEAVDEAGDDLAAIYHSHTRSDPVPSQTDINLAFYPDALYVIVGLKAGDADVRAWRIVDGEVSEAALEVVSGKGH